MAEQTGDEIQEFEQMIIRGLRVPPELLEGDTSYSTTMIALKQLTRENPEGIEDGR